MKQDILSLDNKNVGTIELPESIFGLEVRVWMSELKGE